MLAVLIMLTTGCQNEFIECQKAHVCIVEVLIIQAKCRQYLTVELPARAFRSQEFGPERLQNPIYSECRPLSTTQNEWTFVKYVMEVLTPF